MKKTLVLFTTLSLMLAACDDTAANNGGAAGGGTTPAPVQNTEGGSTPAPAVDMTAAPGSQEGITVTSTPGPGSKTGKETFVEMMASDVPTLDPGVTYDTASGYFVNNIYDTLITYKGSSLTDLEGVLATDWKVSDDGLTYRFTMREGVKFHSGNDFSCADAEYTLRRNLVTNTSESGNWFVAESLLGTQQNANDDASVTWEKISNAVKCEGNELVLTLPKVDPAFLSKLVYYGQAIVDSKHAISIGEWDGTEATWKEHVGKELKASALSKNPSGTGAYQLVRNDSTGVTLKAFDQHWGGAPAIKNYVAQIVTEDSSRLQAFLNGDSDFSDFSGREMIETQVAGQPGVTIVDGRPSTGAFSFSFNQKLDGSTNIGSGNWGDGVPTNFFADEDMRKCFIYAFNYPAYIEQVQMGKGEQLNVLLPKSFLGYDASIPPVPYDLAKAEEHCKKAHGGAAWEQGFTLNMAYVQGGKALQTAAEILKTDLEGMNPKFRINPVGKQWSDMIDPKNIEPLQYSGWSPDYADPDNFIYTFYHSKGYYNKRTNHVDPELDKLIEEARSTMDEARRKELYSQITKHTQEKGYYMHIPSGLGISAYRNNLQGFDLSQRNPLNGFKLKQFSKSE